MYAYIKKFNIDTSSVTVDVIGERFYELNGLLFNPTVEGDLITHDFVSGDVFGAYSKIPITQPKTVTNDNHIEHIERTICKIKSVELSSEGTNLGLLPYTLFPTADTILSIESSANLEQVLIYENVNTPAEIAKNPRPLRCEFLKAGVPYGFLTDKREGFLNIRQDEDNLIFRSLIAKKNYKGSNYQVFFATPIEDIIPNVVEFIAPDLTPRQEIEFDIIEEHPKSVLNAQTQDTTNLINPRYYYDGFNIIDDLSYLVRVDDGVLKKHTQSLPTFRGKKIEIITKNQWNYGTISPVRIEYGEYQRDTLFTVTQVDETTHWVTTFLANDVGDLEQYVWRVL